MKAGTQVRRNPYMEKPVAAYRQPGRRRKL